MDMLLTGGDTELGRTIAEGFRDDGHTVVIAGARRDDLDVAAKELDVDSIVFDNTDPASLEEARSLFPHHLDAIVNVPAPRWAAGDPRAFALGDHAVAWRNALEATLLSAVLTVQILGDHLRSGGAIVNVVPAGRSVEPGYDGIAGTSPSVAAELTRLALFLTTPSARHITGQTLHVSHGSFANFG